MSNLIRPKFPAGLTVKSAIRYLRDLARWVGPGFHPDTDFQDYIKHHGQRAFSDRQAKELNFELSAATSILEFHGVDPCSVGLPIQRELIVQKIYGTTSN